METAWVAPPHQIVGLDHLGVQAPCITIYSTLLPGITNVSDRARYYTLYPWLFTRFDQAGWKSSTDISRMLRRAECLLTLLSLHHGHVTGGDQDSHRAAMVGNDVLGRALDKAMAGHTIRLSDYSKLDDSQDRYFKNKFGGFAQYYFGVLKLLKIMDGETAQHMLVPRETGVKLARMMDVALPGDLFVQTLIDDVVTVATLKALHPFCACQLKQFHTEAETLIKVMLQGWTSLHPDGQATPEDQVATRYRAQTIALICWLADKADATGNRLDVLDFRGLSYCGHDHKGKPLKIPTGVTEIYNKWQTYQRNELLSIALQGLFYAVLRAAELGDQRFANTQSLSQWFWDEGPGAEPISKFTGTLSRALKTRYQKLPAFGHWADDAHEIQAMRRINQKTGQQGTRLRDLSQISDDALTILSALFFRAENAGDYGDFTFVDRYLDRYPVNLQSVRAHWNNQLSAMTIKEGLARLVQRFCLDAHLKVAMRKLQNQGQNTFRFELGEQHLIIKEIPQAAQTSPRFRQTLRILQDLNLLEDHNDQMRTTARGKALVEGFL